MHLSTENATPLGVPTPEPWNPETDRKKALLSNPVLMLQAVSDTIDALSPAHLLGKVEGSAWMIASTKMLVSLRAGLAHAMLAEERMGGCCREGESDVPVVVEAEVDSTVSSEAGPFVDLGADSWDNSQRTAKPVQEALTEAKALRKVTVSKILAFIDNLTLRANGIVVTSDDCSVECSLASLVDDEGYDACVPGSISSDEDDDFEDCPSVVSEINGRAIRYHKAFCSDLGRAHRTARIVLGLDDGYGNEIDAAKDDLIVDSRLRELAKGAREGQPKKLSYEEAIAARCARARPSEGMVVPKLESIDDAWSRAKEWIDAMAKDVHNHHILSCSAKVNEDEIDGSFSGPKVYNIFALSHSALIRTMIHKLVDAELPSDHATTGEGSLWIPNLSRTIIDVQLSETPHDVGGEPRWKPSLVRLADTSHLQKVLANGPPYL